MRHRGILGDARARHGRCRHGWPAAHRRPPARRRRRPCTSQPSQPALQRVRVRASLFLPPESCRSGWPAGVRAGAGRPVRG